jgi:hypothetical protein
MMLLDLADVCRSAGLDVAEEPGWQVRARNGGRPYQAGRPSHVMVHHTASAPANDGARDVHYICHGSHVAPIANLYLSRTGRVTVCAAGPTNTNGAGSSVAWGRPVPADQMNVHAIGIEAANTGTGERWPAVQCDAYVALVAALCRAYAIPIGHVRAHHEWAAGRKIDPAGPSPWADSGSWDMDRFRGDVLNYHPTRPPAIGDDDMIALDHRPGTPEWTAYSWTGTQLAHITDGHADQVLTAAGVRRVTVNDAQLTGIVRSSQCVTPPPATLPADAVPAWN